jgi:hypothetical protein
VTLSRIPRDVEANRHYDLIKQIDVFRNHQTVTSFPRKKFVQKICTNTNDRQPTPKNRRWQLQKRKIIRKGNKRGDLRGETIVVPRYLREAHYSLREIVRQPADGVSIPNNGCEDVEGIKPAPFARTEERGDPGPPD